MACYCFAFGEQVSTFSSSFGIKAINLHIYNKCIPIPLTLPTKEAAWRMGSERIVYTEETALRMGEV